MPYLVCCLGLCLDLQSSSDTRGGAQLNSSFFLTVLHLPCGPPLGQVLDARHIWPTATINAVLHLQPGGIAHLPGCFSPLLATLTVLSCEEPVAMTKEAYYMDLSSILVFQFYAPMACHAIFAHEPVGALLVCVRIFNLAQTLQEAPSWTPPFLTVLNLPCGPPSGQVLDACHIWPPAVIDAVRHFQTGASYTHQVALVLCLPQ